MVAVIGSDSTPIGAVTAYNAAMAALMAGRGTIWLDNPPVNYGFFQFYDSDNASVNIVGQFGYYSAT